MGKAPEGLQKPCFRLWHVVQDFGFGIKGVEVKVLTV